jgi:hypothetical protein
LRDVVGSGVNISPEHIAATGLKVGVSLGSIVIVIESIRAHWPVEGVKV